MNKKTVLNQAIASVFAIGATLFTQVAFGAGNNTGYPTTPDHQEASNTVDNVTLGGTDQGKKVVNLIATETDNTINGFVGVGNEGHKDSEINITAKRNNIIKGGTTSATETYHTDYPAAVFVGYYNPVTVNIIAQEGSNTISHGAQEYALNTWKNNHTVIQASKGSNTINGDISVSGFQIDTPPQIDLEANKNIVQGKYIFVQAKAVLNIKGTQGNWIGVAEDGTPDPASAIYYNYDPKNETQSSNLVQNANVSSFLLYSQNGSNHYNGQMRVLRQNSVAVIGVNNVLTNTKLDVNNSGSLYIHATGQNNITGYSDSEDVLSVSSTEKVSETPFATATEEMKKLIGTELPTQSVTITGSSNRIEKGNIAFKGDNHLGIGITANTGDNTLQVGKIAWSEGNQGELAITAASGSNSITANSIVAGATEQAHLTVSGQKNTTTTTGSGAQQGFNIEGNGSVISYTATKEGNTFGDVTLGDGVNFSAIAAANNTGTEVANQMGTLTTNGGSVKVAATTGNNQITKLQTANGHHASENNDSADHADVVVTATEGKNSFGALSATTNSHVYMTAKTGNTVEGTTVVTDGAGVTTAGAVADFKGAVTVGQSDNPTGTPAASSLQTKAGANFESNLNANHAATVTSDGDTSFGGTTTADSKAHITVNEGHKATVTGSLESDGGGVIAFNGTADLTGATGLTTNTAGEINVTALDGSTPSVGGDIAAHDGSITFGTSTAPIAVPITFNGTLSAGKAGVNSGSIQVNSSGAVSVNGGSDTEPSLSTIGNGMIDLGSSNSTAGATLAHGAKASDISHITVFGPTSVTAGGLNADHGMIAVGGGGTIAGSVQTTAGQITVTKGTTATTFTGSLSADNTGGVEGKGQIDIQDVANLAGATGITANHAGTVKIASLQDEGGTATVAGSVSAQDKGTVNFGTAETPITSDIKFTDQTDGMKANGGTININTDQTHTATLAGPVMVQNDAASPANQGLIHFGGNADVAGAVTAQNGGNLTVGKDLTAQKALTSTGDHSEISIDGQLMAKDKVDVTQQGTISAKNGAEIDGPLRVGQAGDSGPSHLQVGSAENPEATFETKGTTAIVAGSELTSKAKTNTFDGAITVDGTGSKLNASTPSTSNTTFKADVAVNGGGQVDVANATVEGQLKATDPGSQININGEADLTNAKGIDVKGKGTVNVVQVGGNGVVNGDLSANTGGVINLGSDDHPASALTINGNIKATGESTANPTQASGVNLHVASATGDTPNVTLAHGVNATDGGAVHITTPDNGLANVDSKGPITADGGKVAIEGKTTVAGNVTANDKDGKDGEVNIGGSLTTTAADSSQGDVVATNGGTIKVNPDGKDTTANHIAGKVSADGDDSSVAMTGPTNVDHGVDATGNGHVSLGSGGTLTGDVNANGGMIDITGNQKTTIKGDIKAQNDTSADPVKKGVVTIAGPITTEANGSSKGNVAATNGGAIKLMGADPSNPAGPANQIAGDVTADQDGSVSIDHGVTVAGKAQTQGGGLIDFKGDADITGPVVANGVGTQSPVQASTINFGSGTVSVKGGLSAASGGSIHVKASVDTVNVTGPVTADGKDANANLPSAVEIGGRNVNLANADEISALNGGIVSLGNHDNTSKIVTSPDHPVALKADQEGSVVNLHAGSGSGNGQDPNTLVVNADAVNKGTVNVDVAGNNVNLKGQLNNHATEGADKKGMINVAFEAPNPDDETVSKYLPDVNSSIDKLQGPNVNVTVPEGNGKSTTDVVGLNSLGANDQDGLIHINTPVGPDGKQLTTDQMAPIVIDKIGAKTKVVFNAATPANMPIIYMAPNASGDSFSVGDTAQATKTTIEYDKSKSITINGMTYYQVKVINLARRAGTSAIEFGSWMRGTYGIFTTMHSFVTRMPHNGAWANIGRDRWSTKEGFAPVKNHMTYANIGYNHEVHLGLPVQLGVKAGVANGYTNFMNGNRADNRLASVGAYAITQFNGVYTGIEANYLTLNTHVDDNIFKSQQSRRHAIQASVEVAKPLHLADGWYINPEAQFQVVYFQGKTYKANRTNSSNVLRVKADKAVSYQGRVGVEVGKQLGVLPMSVWAKLDAVHEFGGRLKLKYADYSTNMADQAVSITNRGTWLNLNVGADLKVSDAFKVKAAVGTQLGAKDKALTLKLGMDYRF